MSSIPSMTGPESPQLPLPEEAFRLAAQAAPAHQMTSTFQYAILNHGLDGPLSSLPSMTGPESPQLPLPEEAFRLAAQAAPAHQMTSTFQYAILNHGLDGPLSSLEGRAVSLPVAAPPVQPLLAPEVLLPIQQDDHDMVLANDRAIALAAVTQNGPRLRYFSERLKNDRAIALAAVTQNGLALWSVSAGLRADRAIVLAAVTQAGLALQYASAGLENDPAIVLAAITEECYALNYASAGLQNDPTFLLAAVTQNGLVLKHIPVGLRTIEIACAAVVQNRAAMSFVPQDLIKRANGEIDANLAFLPFVDRSLIDYKIGFEAVKLNPLLLRFVPPEILEQRPIDGTEDDDIILLALKQNPEALHLIPWELLTGAMISFVIEMHKRDNKRNLILSLVKLARIMGSKPLAEIRNPHLDLAWPLLEFFKDSKEIMLILINKYGLEASDAGPQIRLDPNITAADSEVLAAALTRAR